MTVLNVMVERTFEKTTYIICSKSGIVYLLVRKATKRMQGI